MPRVVDPAERRALIGEAVWRVILRDGLERASVRNVAREAGLSMGSLRHYFTSQADLMAFSMELVIERVRRRTEALPPGDAAAALAEALPLDAERRAEAEVWLAFTARARVEPSLREVYTRMDEALRGLCAQVVAGLAGGRLDEAAAARETEALYALIDGLALHAVMGSGRAADPEVAMAAVRRHLERLAG